MVPNALTAPHRLVGQSPEIRLVRALIEKVSRSNSPVLILGETGTGKEVVAQSIHDAAPKGPFVPIECGSFVGPLMESEMFGHTRGAFTGANEAKKGLIEAANGGTAFFDEIGDLPLDLQVKLLRVLQEREYRAVGSLVRRRVEIRVIAATHRDLREEVARGRFREDLYFRLNVITIRIPPLRERKEDIPVLVNHFLDLLGAPHAIREEVLRSMMAYPWPGNVRELFNCVQRMTAMAPGEVIEPGDLPSTLRNHTEAAAWDRMASVQPRAMAVAASTGAPVVVTAPIRAGERLGAIQPLAEVEREHILRAVEFCRGDRTAAAALLRIGRTTLYRKLKEYGIDAES